MTGQHNAPPTLQDIRRAHSSWKRDYEKYLPLSRFFFRPLGFSLTWLAVRVQLTTETVSWLSGIFGIAGCLFLIAGKVKLLPLGLALLILFNLLDCVDGSIARSMKTENAYGRFLDSICGGIVDLVFWAVIGIMAFRHEYLLSCPNAFGYGSFFWLALGGATCYLSFLIVYAERTFDELLRLDWEKVQLEKTNKTSPPLSDHERNKTVASLHEPSIRQILRILNNNFRVRETHYFLLVLAFILKTIDIFLLIFCIYYTLHVLLLITTYVNRGRIIKKLY
jgi:phosphatidylglycerophosphate synthase